VLTLATLIAVFENQERKPIDRQFLDLIICKLGQHRHVPQYARSAYTEMRRPMSEPHHAVSVPELAVEDDIPPLLTANRWVA
jgi:hypothetical protein